MVHMLRAWFDVWLQLMQFFYGVATSTEVAYLTYIYACVDDAHFQRVTSYVRAALLLGRFMSGVLSQSLISSGALNFYQLNYISFTTVSVAFCVALCLPRVQHSFYFHRKASSERCLGDDKSLSSPGASMEEGLQPCPGPAQNTEVHGAGSEKSSQQENPRPEEGLVTPHTSGASSPTPPEAESAALGPGGEQEAPAHSASKTIACRSVASMLYSDFKSAYSMPSVVHWSIFWAFSTCGNYQVSSAQACNLLASMRFCL